MIPQFVMTHTRLGITGAIFGVQALVISKLIEDTPQVHIVVEVLVLLFSPNGAVWR